MPNRTEPSRTEPNRTDARLATALEILRMNRTNRIRPDVFLVGAPKSGTTSLNHYLKQHDEIFVPVEKEAHYFGSDLLRFRYTYGLDEYLALYKDALEGQRRLDSSVYYLYSRKAAEEIKAFSPDAQILIMLRNPVEMIKSLHTQLMFNGIEEISDLHLALEAEDGRAAAAANSAEGDAGDAGDAGAPKLDLRLYRRVAAYTEQVQRYFEAFGREKVHVIVFDDFAASTPTAFRGVLEFLKVDPEIEIEFEVRNPARVPQSLALTKLIQKPRSPARTIARMLIPTGLRHRLLRRLIALNSKRAGKAEVDADLRDSLRRDFVDEVSRLGDLLGRDLSHWTRA